MLTSIFSGQKKATAATANIGFEAKLWLAADKLRNHMDAAEYKHEEINS
ncbi:MAG: hypothetical protein ACYDC7_06975 [Acidithiobacillus ferrivorans]|uniref:Uncharacterized protein n=1 Tax=Acidithiobacillus ferrivorans TaxID=160808 RepID=A0A7T4WB65_9PROT|nr:hypothetical protein [Acidithiobacillus ferrivorans]QQD71399.1 hypothetical protein H2515_12740 [Acidithiobacillus ferrivorans]